MGALSVYLDASVLVPLLVADAQAARSDALLRDAGESLIVSDFASAEVSFVLARRVRTGALRAEEARSAFLALDTWVAGAASRAEMVAADLRAAEALIRRLDMPLRAPDALNVAIALRLGARLATFDAQLARAARALGLPLAEG